MYPFEEELDIILKEIINIIQQKNENLSWRSRKNNTEESCLIEILLKYPELNPGDYSSLLQEKYQIDISYETILDFLRYNALNKQNTRLDFVIFIQEMVNSISYFFSQISNRENIENIAKKLYSYISQPNLSGHRIVRISKKMFLSVFCEFAYTHFNHSGRLIRSIKLLQETLRESKASHCIEIVYQLYCFFCDYQKLEYQKLDLKSILAPVQSILLQKNFYTHSNITESLLEDAISQSNELENCFNSLEIIFRDQISKEIQGEWSQIFDALTEIFPIKEFEKLDSPLRLRRLLDVCLYYHQQAREKKTTYPPCLNNSVLALQNISLFLQYIDCFPLTNWTIFEDFLEIPQYSYPYKILYEDKRGINISFETLSTYKGPFLVLSPGWSFQKKHFVSPILCCVNLE
ncbi:MAG: hypothetical protein HUU50_03145 [Candidatus Brocadiae bacterium]|nr:hypothetical protein [Candidatus Brocadiia bacterium]